MILTPVSGVKVLYVTHSATMTCLHVDFVLFPWSLSNINNDVPRKTPTQR